jgi:type I restriction enzyme S subunit
MKAGTHGVVSDPNVPPGAWPSIAFPKTIRKARVGRENQILSSEIKSVGRFPVIDQAQSFISGYSDEEARVIRDDLPLVIFGDHTRVVKFVNFPFILGADGTKVLKPREEIFDARFFSFALQSLSIPSRGYNRHFTLLKERSVPCPDLREQRKIAAVLGLVQRTTEQEERLVALTTELKKALLHQLITHGLRREPQKQTELGLIPQSWEVVELGSIAELINGFAFKSEDYVSDGILNFRVVNIRDEGVIDVANDIEFLPKDFMKTYEQYLLSEGDILVVMVGATRGKLAFIPKTILPALMNQNMWRIVPITPSEIHRRYLYHFLTIAVSTFVRDFSESARGFFKKSDFRSIKIPKPSFEEQKEIAEAIDEVERKMGLHRRKYAALSALFRTLLHALMTARIRVHDVDLAELAIPS